MKIAVLIMCHKNPLQVNRLISSLNHENVSFFIHVDRKSDIIHDILRAPNVYCIDEENRVNVFWGDISQVYASLALLKRANQENKFDYYWLISGQDFPIVNIEKIISSLQALSPVNYLSILNSKSISGKTNHFDKRCDIYWPKFLIQNNRTARIGRKMLNVFTGGWNYTFPLFKRKTGEKYDFYFGSSWWCLEQRVVNWILRYLSENEEILQFFSNTLCPDESFYQTLVMMSPWSKAIKEHFLYVDWSMGQVQIVV